MRRGDLVTVTATGDYGKPRPAVIVQTDAFPESHAFIVICQLTSELADAPDFRVSIDPTPENGLRLPSQIWATNRSPFDAIGSGGRSGASTVKTWSS